MPEHVDEKPLLFIKQVGGTVLLLLGFLVIVLGYAIGSNSVAVMGILLLTGGMLLLVLKIYRRNQP